MVEEQEFVEAPSAGPEAFIGALKRYRLLAFAVTAGVFIAGVAGTFLWPATYESTATVLLEEPEVPQYLVQTTVTTFAAAQIQYINQRVMTRTNLAQIIEKFDLYPEKRRYMPNLLLVEEVRDNMKLNLINVDLTDPTAGRSLVKAIAFTLGFEDSKPDTAQQVANELVSLYLEENVRARTVQTAETSEFLTGEVERLDRDVKKIETEITRFKEENKESLPEMMSVNQAMAQRVDEQLLEVQRRRSGIENSRILLQAQLSQIDPTSRSVMPDGSPVMSSADQLKSMQTRLAMLEGRYSPDHPDVVRTRRAIAALQAESGLSGDFAESRALLADARTQLERARETYAPEHPEVKRLERLVENLAAQDRGERAAIADQVEPDNPAYLALLNQKTTLDMNEESLRIEERRLLDQLKEYEERMLRSPKVEQEAQAMIRRLKSATSRYYSTRDRQFGAEMGEALETQSKGERFVLVEPPNLPLEPASPNRAVLLVLLIILAPAAGIGVVVAKMFLTPVVWGSKMLDAIQGAPPIAEIPVIVTAAEQRRTWTIRIAALTGVPVVAIAGAVLVHFAFRPLDVLWFVFLRQLGI